MKLATKRIGSLKVSYRPDTVDRQVLDIVLRDNRYQFPDDMSGMTVIDIGAHIGSATMLCASRGASVYAYEPAPENYTLCHDNVVGNDFDAHVFQLAVGAPGTRTLYLNPANTASNGDRAIQGHEESEARYVPVEARWVSLKTVFTANKIDHCDYLKMDCEGDEVDVIPEILLLHDKINVIVGETHEGQWPIPTPGLDKQINAAVSSLDAYYTCTQIGGHEYKWTHQ